MKISIHYSISRPFMELDNFAKMLMLTVIYNPRERSQNHLTVVIIV